jgi:hypothetical protein
MSTTINSRSVSACRIPITRKHIPMADRIVPTMSNGRSGSAGRGSRMPRLNRIMIPTTAAWKMNAARQSTAVVMTPPMSGPAAAPMPPRALITPNAHARDVMSSKTIVVRM